MLRCYLKDYEAFWYGWRWGSTSAKSPPLQWRQFEQKLIVENCKIIIDAFSGIFRWQNWVGLWIIQLSFCILKMIMVLHVDLPTCFLRVCQHAIVSNYRGATVVISKNDFHSCEQPQGHLHMRFDGVFFTRFRVQNAPYAYPAWMLFFFSRNIAWKKIPHIVWRHSSFQFPNWSHRYATKNPCGVGWGRFCTHDRINEAIEVAREARRPLDHVN